MSYYQFFRWCNISDANPPTSVIALIYAVSRLCVAAALLTNAAATLPLSLLANPLFQIFHKRWSAYWIITMWIVNYYVELNGLIISVERSRSGVHVQLCLFWNLVATLLTAVSYMEHGFGSWLIEQLELFSSVQLHRPTRISLVEVISCPLWKALPPKNGLPLVGRSVFHENRPPLAFNFHPTNSE